MPLLRRKPFTAEPPPPDLSMEEEVFFCDLTEEVFRDYEQFYERMILCNSLVWSCSISGKASLTYKEALESEEKIRKETLGLPAALQRAVLQLVHHTRRGKLQELSEAVFDFLRYRYQPNETVEVKIVDGWQKAIIGQCSNESNVQMLSKQLKSPRTIDTFFNKSVEQDKENDDNQTACMKSVLDRDVSELTEPTTGLYRVTIRSGKKSGDVLMLRGSFIRREKGFTRDRVKMLVKQTCARTDMHSDTGYWVVKKSEAVKHSLGMSSLGPAPALKSPSKKKKPKQSSGGQSIAELKAQIKEKKNSEKQKLKERERERDRKEKEKEKERERTKVEQEKQRALSLAEKEKLQVERERLRIDAEQERRRKFLERETEKARKRDEIKREKDIEKQLKKLEGDFQKIWSKPREDLKLENLQPLPSLKPLRTQISQDLIGDCLMVAEFANTFGNMFEIEQEIEEKITFEWMEQAVLEHDAEGNYFDICKFLLHTYLRHVREEANEDEEEEESSGDNTPAPGGEVDREQKLEQKVDEEGSSKVSHNARAAAAWSMLHQGMELNEISIEPASLTEVLRLLIMSSGVQLGGAKSTLNWNDWQRGGAATIEDDPCYVFRHQEQDIMRALATSSVYDFPAADKLKLLVLLCDQILTLRITRETIEDSFDRSKELRKQLRELQNTENKRRKALASAKWKEQRDEREKIKQEKKEEEERKKAARDAELQKKISGPMDAFLKDGSISTEPSTTGDTSVPATNGTAKGEAPEQHLEVEDKDEEPKLTKEEELEQRERKEERKRIKEQKEEEAEEMLQNNFRFEEELLMAELAKVNRCVAEVPLGRDRLFRRFWCLNDNPCLLVENLADGAVRIAEVSDTEYESDGVNGISGDDTETEAEASADEGDPLSTPDASTPTDAPSTRSQRAPTFPHVSFEELISDRNAGLTVSTKLFQRYRCPLPDPPELAIQKSSVFSSALASVQSGLDPVCYSTRDPTKWYEVDSIEQFRALLDSFNERGVREQKLKETCTRDSSKISELILSRSEAAAAEEMETTSTATPTTKKSDPADIDKSLFRSMDDFLNADLRDSMLEFEGRIFLAGFGAAKVTNRDEWRQELEKGIAELIHRDQPTQQSKVNPSENTSEVDMPDIEVPTEPVGPNNINVGEHDDESMDVEEGNPLNIEGKSLSTEANSIADDENRCSTPTNLITSDERNPFVKLLAKALLDIEQGIENKYLKPPLGETDESKKERIKEMIEAAATTFDGKLDESIASLAEEEASKVPSTCLSRWEESLMRATNYSQINIHLLTLDRSVMWDKSVQNAKCRTCRRKGDEEQMLLCDGCDRGFHMYCLKPKVKKVPQGDWFCHDCKPAEIRATPSKRKKSQEIIEVESENEETEDENEDEEEDDDEVEDSDEEDVDEESEEEEDEDEEEEEAAEVCTICAAEGMLILCDDCPRAFHTDCCHPPLRKVPRGKWLCQVCTGTDAELPASKRARTIEKKRAKALEDELKPKKSQQHQPHASKKPAAAAKKKSEPKKRNMSPATTKPSKRVKLDEEATPVAEPARRGSVGFGRHQLKQCATIINEIVDHPDADVFLEPVDTKEIVDYLKFIDNPMDFGTIKINLNTAKFAGVDAFLQDVRQVLINCEIYNPAKHAIAQQGARLRKFVEKRIRELDLEE